MKSQHFKTLLRNPRAFQTFMLTGKLPQQAHHRPSPLQLLLEAIPKRELGAIRHIRLNLTLGYRHQHVWRNGQQLLNWLNSRTGRSWQEKRFNKRLTLLDLQKSCIEPNLEVFERINLRIPRQFRLPESK